jgi:cell division protein FtsN
VTYKGRATKKYTKEITKKLVEKVEKHVKKKTVVPQKQIDKKKENKKKLENKVSQESVSTPLSDTYYIQTGSFSKKPSSEYLAKIKKLGLSYNTKFKGNYKVFVGPYNIESKARASLEKVRMHINKGAFLVHNQSFSMSESRETLY